MSKKLLKEKLKLEIAELNKKWYQKMDFLKVLLPTVLAIFSLLYALTSGFFSSKSELLELKKQQLQFEISQFQKEKEELINTNSELEIKREKLFDSLSTQSELLKNYESSLRSERYRKNELSKELTILKNTRNNYNLEIQQLESDYQKKKETYLKEIKTNYYKEIDYEKIVSGKTDSINKLKDRIQDLEYNIKLLRNSPFTRNSKRQFNFPIWENKEMMKYHQSKIDKIVGNMAQNRKEMEKAQKSMDSLNVQMKLLKMN